MNTKKAFIDPELEVTQIEVTDVITTSIPGDEPTSGDWGGGFVPVP